MGNREVPFSRELYIEKDDFHEDPPRKFFRLAPGREVRLKGAYIIKCESVIKDEATGEIVELRCTYDPDTRSGTPGSARKVKGTLHWVSAKHATEVEVRLYDNLFTKENPDDTGEGETFVDYLNPNSLEVLGSCMVEKGVAEDATPGMRYQFLRKGYFCLDPDSTDDKLVFNRIVSLRDTWARIQKQQKKKAK